LQMCAAPDDVVVEHFLHQVPRYYWHCQFSLQLAD